MTGNTDSATLVRASLDLTHVLYEDDSFTSWVLAMVTLSPILLMASYASLAFQTREIIVINMWAGQLASEAINYVLKHLIREPRPNDTLGSGYGFPSSHSQWMAYFASFLIFHILYRHRFSPSGFGIAVDRLWVVSVCACLASWAGAVAYSRYALGYHAPNQVGWGAALGVLLGSGWYYVTEVMPRTPKQYGCVERWVASLRKWEVDNPLSRWMGVRDGWAVWADGGRDAEWREWRRQYDRKLE